MIFFFQQRGKTACLFFKVKQNVFDDLREFTSNFINTSESAQRVFVLSFSVQIPRMNFPHRNLITSKIQSKICSSVTLCIKERFFSQVPDELQAEKKNKSKVQSEFIIKVIWPINLNSLSLSKLSPKIKTNKKDESGVREKIRQNEHRGHWITAYFTKPIKHCGNCIKLHVNWTHNHTLLDVLLHSLWWLC